MRKAKKITTPAIDKNPGWLRSKPEGAAPLPPISTRPSALPFLQLPWPDFERLCLALAEREGDVEAAWHYGKTGHAQHGIDILVRLNDGGFEVWQSKRHQSFSAPKIKNAVGFFLKHEWAKRAKRFVLAVACDFDSPETVKAVEEARDLLRDNGIEFDPLGATKLSNRLKEEPELVDDFFDRPWATRFCPLEIAERLASRLNRFEAASARNRLLDWYRSWALTVDAGLPISGLDHLGRARPPVPLSERFVEPDLLVGSARHENAEFQPSRNLPTEDARLTREGVSDDRSRPVPTSPRVLEQRLPLARVLASERKILIAGGAGAGKSTLLRFLAIDILEAKPTLEFVRRHYADHLPIWIPFAYWANLSKDGTPIGLQTVVQKFFEAHSDPILASALSRAFQGSQIILLVDGLDEASDPTIANTLAGLLATFVEQNDIPVIATTRPQGLSLMSTVAPAWPRSSLAPLSDPQRYALARVWFTILERFAITADTASGIARAEQHAKAFITALQRSPGAARLSQTPLFLLSLLALHRDGHVLPRSRFAATRVMVEQLIEHQPSKRARAALQTASRAVDRLRDRLIEDFAFALQAEELKGDVPNTVHESAAIERATTKALGRIGGSNLDAAEDRAREIFEFGEERAGLLVKPAGADLGFLHLSFQEYLAAKHISGFSSEERRDFVRRHAHLPRWREPILYLLFILANEHEVGSIVSAIEEAEASDEPHAWNLLVEATYCDFDHDLSNVRRLAQRFFEEVETFASGESQKHLLSQIVSGLLSEAVGDDCQRKIAEWLPDRHGYARVSVARAVPMWIPSLRSSAHAFLKRNLVDDDLTSRDAAEALVQIAGQESETKAVFLNLVRRAPFVQGIANGLYGLALGWANDEDVLDIAEKAKRSVDRRIALEAIRIRARARVADNADLGSFIELGWLDDHYTSGDLFAPELQEHFGKYLRTDFTTRLEKRYKDVDRRGRIHDLISVVGGLIYCNPDHPLVTPGLEQILSESWAWDNIFTRDKFPAARVPWQGTLLKVVEDYVTDKEKYRQYEFYWIAKVCPLPILKQKFIDALRADEHLAFWSARALVEVWGGHDPEIQALFDDLLASSTHSVEPIAAVLPQVVADHQKVRQALLQGLRNPQERVDHILEGLRSLDIADDDELFEAAWAARGKLRGGPLYQNLWCSEIIRTFPNRQKVRELVFKEILGHDGAVGAIAETYVNDAEILSALLKKVAPLSQTARLHLVSELQAISPVDSCAFALLSDAREDSDGTVRSEAMMTWTDIAAESGPLASDDVSWLLEELDALGPIYEDRRAAAAVCLLHAHRFDAVVASRDHKTEPRKYSICRASFRADSRFLSRVLSSWDKVVEMFGDERTALERLGITTELALPLLEPSMPHAERLYERFYPEALESDRIALNVPLESAALFHPKSQQVKDLALSILLTERVFTAGERVRNTYLAELAAGSILAEQFGLEKDIVERLADVCRSSGGRPAIWGALAEFLLRYPDDELATLLGEKACGQPIDQVNYLKLVAALSAPERLAEELAKYLAGSPKDTYEVHLPRWLPSVLRRAQSDAETRDACWTALQCAQSPSEKASFALILKRSGFNARGFLPFVEQQLRGAKASDYPEVGYDLLAGIYRPLPVVFREILV